MIAILLVEHINCEISGHSKKRFVTLYVMIKEVPFVDIYHKSSRWFTFNMRTFGLRQGDLDDCGERYYIRCVLMSCTVYFTGRSYLFWK